MPSAATRSRRRAAVADEEDEAPRQRRTAHGRRGRPVEEEEEEEQEEEEGEADEEQEEEEDYEEEDDGGYEDEGGHSRSRRRSHKRKRRSRREQDAEGPGGGGNDEDDEDDDDEDGEDGEQLDRQQAYYELLAKKLVRYALASEPRRLPIRRQAVKEQVLEKQGKSFRKVFPLAQAQLRGIFGMEMVEWPARDEATMSLRERRKALKTQKAATATTAAAAARADRFVLLSTLPDDYRASVFASLASTEEAGGGGGGDEEEGAAIPHPNAPAAPDAAFVGFCTLVVALITLSGGALDHADLEKYLTMLYGAGQGPVIRADADLLPVAAALGDHVEDDDAGGGGHGGGAGGTGDDGSSAQGGGTLQHLVRQGYVVRVVEAPATAEGRGPVGGRSAGGGGGSGSSSGAAVASGAKVTWHVGPRGRLEIGPAEVAAVVRHIYGPDANANIERRLKSSLRTTKERENGEAAASEGGRGRDQPAGEAQEVGE